MTKRRSFVPESLNGSSLEGRVVLSTFGDIGNWFDSQYNNVKKDLGITHKKSSNNGNLLKMNAQLGNPSPASSFLHVTPATSTHAATTHLVKMK